MKHNYFGSISRKSETNKYGGVDKDDDLEGVIGELKDGHSGVFVAPAGTGRSHFLACVSEKLSENNITSIYIDLSLISDASLILREHHIEEIEGAAEVVFLLDSFEHIVQNNQSLHSLLVGIEQAISNVKLQFLVTSLPIDYLLSKPHHVLEKFQNNKPFIAAPNPFTVDEFESYIEALPNQDYSSSPKRELLDIISWIRHQGLENYCSWPKDIYWLKQLHEKHSISSCFVSLDVVFQFWTRYELEYAYREYNAFDLGEAKKALEEVFLASSFSDIPIEKLYGKYDFCMTGNDLLTVFRSGIFTADIQGNKLKTVCEGNGWHPISNYSDWHIANLFQRKLSQGMPESFLFSFAQVSVGDNQRLRGYVKGAMSFLSIQPEHHWLKGKMITDYPEAIIDMADPSKLTITDRKAILESLQAKLHDQNNPEFEWLSQGLKRFFSIETSDDLAQFAKEQYNSSAESGLNENKAFLKLLTQMFNDAGNTLLLEDTNKIFPTLADKDHIWQLEAATIQYLSGQGGTQYSELLLDYVNYTPDENYSEISKYARRLYYVAHETFQRGMSIPLFLDNLKKVIDVQTNESTGLGSLISSYIWQKLATDQEKNSLIEGILNILAKENSSLNTRYRWLISVLGKLAVQYFKEHKIVDLSQPAGLVLKNYLNWKNPSPMSSEHTSIPISIAIDAFFELKKVKRAWVRHKFEISNVNDITFYDLTTDFFLHGGLLTDHMSHDEELAIEIAKDIKEDVALREFASQNIQSIGALEDLLALELESETVANALNARVEVRKQAARNFVKYAPPADTEWEEEQEQKKLEADAQKQQFINKLIANREKVQSAEYIGYLWELCRLDWNSTGFSNFSEKKLEEKFGKEWIEVAKTGLVNLLEQKNALPCKTNATDQENFYYTATMVHQAICLRKNEIRFFSTHAINNAVAATTWEINSPPDWIRQLIHHHEIDVKNILKQQLTDEAVSTATNNNSIHQFARFGDNELGRICWDIIAELLESKTYANLDALIDASEIAVKLSADTNLFAKLYEMYGELSMPNAELLSNVITVSPEYGLPLLTQLNESVSSKEDKDFLINVVGNLIRGRTSKLKLNRILSNAEHISSFVRTVVSITSDDQHRIAEGVFHSTPESEVTWFRQSLYSVLCNLPYDIAKEFVDHLEQDHRLKSKIPWISRIEKETAEKEANEPLQVQLIESWIGGNWAKNIRTVGQLHNHIIAILDDIYQHISFNDFSSKPLWKALVGNVKEKDTTLEQDVGLDNLKKKDRTLEEHAQVWLANELRYRSNGIYNVKREDQSINNKRRDITISIPAVGSCVIEIKLANKKNGYSYNYLLNETINKQIVQYIRDDEHRAATLLLFSTNPSKRKLPDGSMGSAHQIAESLEKDTLDNTIKNLEKFSVYPFVIS